MGGEDAEEYKRSLRTRLRELVDRAGEPQAGAAPDWLVLYACPPAAGPASKPAGKARPCLLGRCLLVLQHMDNLQRSGWF